jgi:transcriptional regulator GlxA family with amidase domain
VHDGKLVSSAGVTAGIDLALSLLADDGGARLALQVARRLSCTRSARAGSRSSAAPDPVVDAASPVAQAQQYVLAHLDGALDVASLARLVAMSPRNFARIFARELGVTPAHFIESARLDAARAMLAASDAPLKTVAWRCGFGTADQLRTVFLRRLGVSAKQYRQHFSSRPGA